jgi:hypothetical protein
MMAYVNDDIEPESALSNDRFVQGVKEYPHIGFEIRTFTPRPQTNPR